MPPDATAPDATAPNAATGRRGDTPAEVLAEVLADLAAESDELDRTVAGLTDDGWATPTPAAGWTVAHQISHLAWTDRMALLAITDPDAFTGLLGSGLDALVEAVAAGAADGAAEPAGTLLARWRRGRAELADALAGADGRVPWFGPPMRPLSMVTARLMETWAHGQDVADALGRHREPTARLRHVAHLAVRTRDFAFLLNDRTPPAEPFRVELTGPAGEVWTWGPPDAGQRVTGPALDLCLLATQRRHRADLAVLADGPDADAWLDIAQAFAGPPGAGREPQGGRRTDNAGAGARPAGAP